MSRSGTVNGADKITFAHEYDHALQDANFDVFQDPEALRDQTDEALARAALYEGDATLLMSLWAIPNLTPEELQEVVAAGNDPEANEILAATPPILTESLLFPYNAGLAFIQPKQLGGGWAAVDELYGRLPASTEQVIHPEKYDADEAPIAVTLPTDLAAGMGDGWTVALEDTWGEFQTGIWLREAGVPVAEAGAGRGRLGRRPPGRAVRTERHLGGGHAVRVGQRRRRRRVRDRGRHGHQDRRWSGPGGARRRDDPLGAHRQRRRHAQHPGHGRRPGRLTAPGPGRASATSTRGRRSRGGPGCWPG